MSASSILHVRLAAHVSNRWKSQSRTVSVFAIRNFRLLASVLGKMEKIKAYMWGWLNYYRIADMKNNMEKLNRWVYRRIRMCIWKQ